MKNLIKRSVLAGVGLLSLTREKAQEYVDELVEKGEARREDANDLVERLTKRGEEERKSMRKLVRDEVSNVMSELGVATQKDMQDLGKKIDTLNKEDEK